MTQANPTGNRTAQGRAQQIAALSAAVVQSDPVLRYKLKSIVEGVLDHMAMTMVHGDSQSKMALTKSITPHLLAGLQAAESSDADRAKAETYDRIMAYCRGEITIESFGQETVAQDQTLKRQAG